MLLTGRDQMAVCISFPGFCNVHIPLQHSHLTLGAVLSWLYNFPNLGA